MGLRERLMLLLAGLRQPRSQPEAERRLSRRLDVVERRLDAVRQAYMLTEEQLRRRL